MFAFSTHSCPQMLAIKSDIRDLSKAVTLLDITVPWHCPSTLLWFRYFARHIHQYISINELLVHPWLSRRAHIPTEFHANHTTTIDQMNKIYKLLYQINEAPTTNPKSMSLQAADLVLELRSVVAAMASHMQESFREEVNTMCTLMDAHFTPKEYTTSLRMPYWDAWLELDSDINALISHRLEAMFATVAVPSHAERRSRGMSLFSPSRPLEGSAAEKDGFTQPPKSPEEGSSRTVISSPLKTSHGASSMPASPPMSSSAPLLPAAFSSTPLPAASASFPDLDNVLSLLLPWLTQAFAPASDEEECVLSCFSSVITPSVRGKFCSHWRLSWEKDVRALITSIFDDSQSVPLRVAGVAVKCGCL
jgi:hypothetical protein